MEYGDIVWFYIKDKIFSGKITEIKACFTVVRYTVRVDNDTFVTKPCFLFYRSKKEAKKKRG